MCTIKNIYEPRLLAVAWQEPEGENRTRHIVAQLEKSDRGIVFRYLTRGEDFKKAQQQGFTYYPAFRKIDREYPDRPLDSFMRRLPPRTRGDYAKYLAQWCLTPEQSISDFALLGYTGASLPTDGFSITPILEDVTAPAEFLMEVTGVRHQNIDRKKLTSEMPVTFKKEPENPKDPAAIAIYAQEQKIGYVNRIQTKGIANLMESNKVKPHIERINGTTECPNIYLFVEVR